MMALSAVRHSPYSLPSQRFNPMTCTAYNPHFNSGTLPGASTYSMPSSSMFGLQSSVFTPVSPMATCGTALHGNGTPTMNLLPGVMSSSSTTVSDNTSEMATLSDANTPDHSPGSCCSESPTSPPDLSVEDSPSANADPYKSCAGGCYSSLSPPSSLNGLTNSILNGNHSPPPLPGSSVPYPTPAPSTMFPTPMYSSHDYSSSAALSSSMPSLSMPMWSPYPSLPSVGPLPSPSLPKLSYDSPRYKLTPERAIPLIKWFEEHKEHPYPTRHEKILLCQSTQLTFTQVSTWFANARRRMKKAISEEEDGSSQGSGSGSGSERESSPDCNNSNVRSSN